MASKTIPKPKVDMDVINTKLDYIIQDIAEIKEDNKSTCKQVNVNQVAIATALNSISHLDNDVKGLVGRVNTWNGLNSLGVIIASIFGLGKS